MGMHIIKGNDSGGADGSYNIEKMCRQGKMTHDKIAEYQQTRSGREALNRYSNKLHADKAHINRLYGKQWDGIDEKGQLYKDVEDNNEDIIR